MKDRLSLINVSPAYMLPAMKMADRLKKAREQKGLSQQQVADHLGISRGAVGNWEKEGSNNPETDRLPMLAKLYEVSSDYLLGLADEPEPSNVRAAPELRLGSVKNVPDSIPVYGTARGGTDGDFILNMGEPLEWRSRPAQLIGKGDIFGLYVEGESMSPRYDDGEVILVYSKRPVIPGRDVVIQMKIHEDGANPRAYLKRLVSKNSEQIVVEQLNPPKKRTIKMAEIQSLHLVLLRSEMV
jgi:phage repressor protein C with HTH and peptisase S24 domain